MKFFTPYKGRNVLPGQLVDVYRNVNKKGVVYSIRDAKTGLVLGHATHILLNSCTFHVNPAGRKKVLLTKKKNVHAWIRGHFGILHAGDHEAWRFQEEAKYNPYRNERFVTGTNQPLYRAGLVYIEPESGVNVMGYEVCNDWSIG